MTDKQTQAQIKPFKMDEGKITAILIGSEVFETPPIPFDTFPSLMPEIQEYFERKREFEAFVKALDLVKEKYELARDRFEHSLTLFREPAVHPRATVPVAERFVSPIKPEPLKVSGEPTSGEKAAEMARRAAEATRIWDETLGRVLHEDELRAREEAKRKAEVSVQAPVEPKPKPEEALVVAAGEKVVVEKPIAMKSDLQIANEIYGRVEEELKKVSDFNEDELKIIVAQLGVPEARVPGVVRETMELFKAKGVLMKGGIFRWPKLFGGKKKPPETRKAPEKKPLPKEKGQKGSQSS